MAKADDTVWFEFVESKVFSEQVRELSVEVLTNIQSELVQNPERGDIVKETHGVRKARVADPSSDLSPENAHHWRTEPTD